MKDKYFDYLAHTFHVLFIIFCILFFKERLFNCDASYYTWHITNNADFFIKHDRWINYIMQFPALWAVEHSWPLKYVVMIYSTTFGVIYYLLFLIFRYLFLPAKWALFPALALLLSLRYKHFAGHTEIVVAIFLAALFLSFVCSQSWSTHSHKVKWPVVVVLCVAMIFTHPVIVLPISIVLLYHTLLYKKWKNQQWWVLIAFVVLIFGVRFGISMQDAYEGKKVSSISNIWKVITKPSDLYSVKVIIQYLSTDYLPVLACLSYVLFRLRKTASGLFYLFFALSNVGMLVLIAAIESYLRSDIFVMIDGYLGMLGLLWGYVFIYYANKHYTRTFRYVITLLMIICGTFIALKGSFFTQRLTYFEEIVKENPDSRKYYIDLQQYDWEVMWYPYEIPFDMLMLTSLKGKSHGHTLYVNYSKADFTEELERDDIFLSFRSAQKAKALNQDYYQLPDDKYKKLDHVPWK